MNSADLSPTSLASRCARIELLVLDVDGVLTEGGITYGNDGFEIKTFHVRDGSGIKIWNKAGKRSVIITGRTSAIVDARAAELGIHPVVQGSADKLSAFREILTQFDLKAEQACVVGDDLPDLGALAACGLGVAVADACPEVIAAALHVTRVPGGHGAVRETIELILNCQGLWPAIVEGFRNR